MIFPKMSWGSTFPFRLTDRAVQMYFTVCSACWHEKLNFIWNWKMSSNWSLFYRTKRMHPSRLGSSLSVKMKLFINHLIGSSFSICIFLPSNLRWRKLFHELFCRSGRFNFSVYDINFFPLYSPKTQKDLFSVKMLHSLLNPGIKIV